MQHATGRITFDPATLTDHQRDGLACVVCGLDYETGTVPTPHVPVGMVDGGQVFACVTCPRDTTSQPGVWPDGKPATAPALADRAMHVAGQLDDLAAEFRDDSGMGHALSNVAEAFRGALDAMQGREDVGAALDDAEQAIGRARVALAVRRAR